MRLRTYESYWLLRNGLLQSYPSVSQNLRCDIVVVGAGITGALTSHALQKKGYKVIVLDKGDVASGSTSATTSMLQYEVDETLIDLADMIGPDGAAACYLAGVDAIDELAHLVKAEKIDCGFELKDSLYLSHDSESAKTLKEEFEARQSIGLPVRWLSSTQVKKAYGMVSHGAILSKKGASLDAYRLAHGLFDKNCRRPKNPLQVFDQTPIKKVTESPRGVKVELETGFTVTCKKIVYCNGFEAVNVVKENIASLFDTYACVSEKVAKMPKTLKDTLIWNTEDPYFYMRTTEDGRILMGGEDSSFRMGLLRQTIKERKSEKLIKKLAEIAPKIPFIEDYTWAGTFGKTKDGLPYIGKSPEFKHTYFVLGFGGNGITFSTTAMKVIPDLLEGKSPALAHFYRFGR